MCVWYVFTGVYEGNINNAWCLFAGVYEGNINKCLWNERLKRAQLDYLQVWSVYKEVNMYTNEYLCTDKDGCT